MDHLRHLFEAIGFTNVQTFIASGNVIFDATLIDTKALERQIEDSLREALGYEVATFIRTTSEVAEIARYQPFNDSEDHALYIAFLAAPPGDEAKQKLLSFANEIDEFHVSGREVYWLCRKKMSESAFSGALLEKTLRMQATLRNSTTIRKIAAKYP
jgi:uncharacterized protein (DUF1697 family)